MTRVTTDQAIGAATWTKVQLNSESFDQLTKGTLDAVTNYRYTANEAVTVQVHAHVYVSSVAAASEVAPAIYKNGSASTIQYDMNTHTGSRSLSVQVSETLELATNDYIALYIYTTTAEDVQANTWMTLTELN